MDILMYVSLALLAVAFIMYAVKHYIMLYKLKRAYRRMHDSEIRMDRKLRDSSQFTKSVFRWTSKGAERHFK